MSNGIEDTMATGVPWEDPRRGFFDRLLAQLVELSIRPITAGRVLRGPTPSLAPATQFATIAVAIAYAPLALCLPCLLLLVPMLAASRLPPAVAGLEAGMVCAIVAGMPFALLFGHVLSDLVFAASFHGLSRLAGGTGAFRDSLRVALYTRATTAWMLVVWFLAWIPFVGTFLQIGFRVLLILWSAFTFFGAAQGVHGLNEDRSILVALGTAFVGTGMLAVIGGAIALLVILLMFGSLTAFAALFNPT